MSEGKNVTVFQVPHHGSARNSLHLEKTVLPPPEDITVVKQVFAFKVFLAYQFDRGNWKQIEREEIGDDGVNRFNNSVQYLGVIFEDTISIFVPAIVQALDYLLPVSIKKCKAEHFYDQVNNAINTIEKRKRTGRKLTWRIYLNYQMKYI